MQVYEYVKAPTGTVHLSRMTFSYGSLCGLPTAGWIMLDETVSGRMSTCGRCLRSLGKDQA